MSKKLLIVITGLSMVGCAGVRHVSMTPEVANTLKDREVATVKRDKPSFMATTPGKAGIGGPPLGTVLMVRSGNEIVSKNNIEDPAVYIGEKLRTELSTRYGTKVSSKSVTLTNDSVQTTSRSDAGVDLLLDVSTVTWSFAYFPLTWSKYRVIYAALLRLTDTKDGKILVDGTCSRVPDKTPTSPTYDELLANGAERLKKELREAADFCVGEFISKVLRF
jgi:hypothetical protein